MRAEPLAVAILACGCSSTSTVAMHRVDAMHVEAVQGDGIVVFVRPPDPCASGSAFAIVDERGEYIGESAPESHFAVELPEGEHVFYAWDPHGELRSAKYPDVNQIGAVRVHVESRRPAYVEVTTASGAFAVRKTCSTYRWIELRHVGKNHGELDDWLRATRPYAADRAAGQRWIDADAAGTRRRIEMGAKKLEARDERGAPPPPSP